MNDYRKLRFTLAPCSETVTDIAAALLADVGFESFEPDQEGLTAYIQAPLYDREAALAAMEAFPVDGVEVTLTDDSLVEGRDWNQEWERNYFSPIVIGSRCVIHASFHTDIPTCDYDILIDPRMAFGTGHHDTTSLIISQLLDFDLAGLSVADVGTGTGILAILASMRGAASVTAIEIDEFAYLNAIDNVALNHCENIIVKHGDASLLPATPTYDLLIANINRNVILTDLPRYARALRSGGRMLLSGFYAGTDAQMITEAAQTLGLELAASHSASPRPDGDQWTCLTLIKS